MLNRVSIMGRVAREIDLRQTQSGVSYAKFSIAVERNMVNKSTGKRDVDFVEMEAWKNTAELLSKYFPKGSMLVAEGTLRTDNWKDKDGQSRSRTYVLVDQVYFTGSKQDGQKNNDAKATTQNESEDEYENEYDEFDESKLPY